MPIGNILHTHIHARIGALTHTHTLPTRHGDWRQTRRHREQTHTHAQTDTRDNNTKTTATTATLAGCFFFLFFSSSACCRMIFEHVEACLCRTLTTQH